MSIASTSERNEAKFREYNYRQEVTQADSSALFFSNYIQSVPLYNGVYAHSKICWFKARELTKQA